MCYSSLSRLYKQHFGVHFIRVESFIICTFHYTENLLFIPSHLICFFFICCKRFGDDIPGMEGLGTGECISSQLQLHFSSRQHLLNANYYL